MNILDLHIGDKIYGFKKARFEGDRIVRCKPVRATISNIDEVTCTLDVQEDGSKNTQVFVTSNNENMNKLENLDYIFYADSRDFNKILRQKEKEATEEKEIIEHDIHVMDDFRRETHRTKALVIVDCQNDFINGSLGVGMEKWEKALNRIEKEINSGEYNRIIVTMDWHPLNHCSFKKNGGKWEQHCVADSAGADLYWKLEDLLKGKCPEYIMKGKRPDKEEYGIDIYEEKCHPLSKTDFYFTGIALDYCVSECARLTAERDKQECQCYIIREGCCAINDNAIPNIGKAEII